MNQLELINKLNDIVGEVYIGLLSSTDAKIKINRLVIQYTEGLSVDIIIDTDKAILRDMDSDLFKFPYDPTRNKPINKPSVVCYCPELRESLNPDFLKIIDDIYEQLNS